MRLRGPKLLGGQAPASQTFTLDVFSLPAGIDPSSLALGAVFATLIILVAYLMLTIGALKFLFLSGRARVRRWEIVIPVAAIVVLGYVLFRNVWPIPAGDQPAFWYAVTTAAWLLVSVVIVYARPDLARRVSERLAVEEGLAAARS